MTRIKFAGGGFSCPRCDDRRGASTRQERDDEGNDLAQPGLRHITQYAGDAKVMVNGSIEVTSSTNTFKDIISGVSITLQDGALVGDVSEISIKPDDAPIRSALEGFVTAYNALNGLLSEATKFDAATKQGGLLQGDSFAIGIQNAMRGILQSTTSGSAFARLSDIGISQGRIVQIGASLPKGVRNIDAAGRVVTPGGVDAHCHLDQPMTPPLRMADDFDTGRREYLVKLLLGQLLFQLAQWSRLIVFKKYGQHDGVVRRGSSVFGDRCCCVLCNHHAG